MKIKSWFSLLLISTFVLAGCEPASPMKQPTQRISTLSSTTSMVPATLAPSSTPLLFPTKTPSPIIKITKGHPTATTLLSKTPTLLNTLDPEKVKATIQPLLINPINCNVLCFWGIIPGKTHFDEAKVFFSHLGFTPFEGKDSGRDFYTISYLPGGDYDFSATFYTSNNFVENIVVTPRIGKQIAGSPRKWIAYSPETLIVRYGKPSRVEFGIDRGPNFVIEMIMYFDSPDLIALYSEYNMFPDRPYSPRICPLIAPFDHVRLWMGFGAPNQPPEAIPLEKATSISIDQFSQLMLGDPKDACFILNGNAFQ